MTAGAAPLVDNARGALLLTAAALAFTAEVVCVRMVSGAASDGQIVFARAAAQLLAVTPLIAVRGWATLATRRPGTHLLRGLTSLVCWWLYYRSFQALDMALATTLTFSTSLFVVVLAGPALGERVGAVRWATTALGFVGVAVASGALTAEFRPEIWLGLGAAVSGAALVFQNRVLARTEATLAIMFYIGLIAALGTLPAALADWRPLPAATVGTLALAGALGSAGLFLTIEAYRVGEVSALAPFPYVRLLFAAAAGWLIFAEPPTPATLAGGALIAACAVAATRDERRRGLAAPHR